jgi:hypothetical protein
MKRQALTPSQKTEITKSGHGSWVSSFLYHSGSILGFQVAHEGSYASRAS